MRSPPLFYDDHMDAIAQMISASGRTYKECAAFLYPSLKPESAYARLKHAVRAEHGEDLKFSEVVALSKFCGQPDVLWFFEDEMSHERSRKVEPANELMELEREFIAASKRMEKVAERIATLQQSPDLKRVA